jgi:O-antigen/teichoic acid export membrane protein
MLAAQSRDPALTGKAHRAAFFRQSGWLMIANIGGGMLMWAVHFLSRVIGPTEYGIFGAFLAVAMCIPTMPLQVVLAHQTAKALATHRERELAGMIRLVWLGTFVLWAISAILVLALQTRILERWQVTNPAALWVTLPIVLLSLWLPVFSGVLQGQQNFLWLGWSMILNGAGRLTVAAAAVLVLGGLGTGMMTGVLLGMVLGTGVAAWQTRLLWLKPSLPFDWRSLLREVVPPMLGIGAFQFLFTADTMFVKGYFTSDEAGFYVSAGTLSRALMWLVGPLAAVMFPRIVHSAAKAEKTDLMGLVLIGTAILAVGGAVSLSVLGPWIVKFVSGGSFVKVAASVLPWYAAAMVPLALANVLLNNLLARSFFRVVPALCVLAIAYGFALTRFHDSLVMVLKTLGVFNLLLLAICAWFTWGTKVPNAETGSDQSRAGLPG